MYVYKHVRYAKRGGVSDLKKCFALRSRKDFNDLCNGIDMIF